MAPILSGALRRGTALDEPFLMASGEHLQFVGGAREASIPVRYAETVPAGSLLAQESGAR